MDQNYFIGWMRGIIICSNIPCRFVTNLPLIVHIDMTIVTLLVILYFIFTHLWIDMSPQLTILTT